MASEAITADAPGSNPSADLGVTSSDSLRTEEEQIPDDADETTRIKYLTTGTRAQDDLERDIGRQADQMLTEQADARDKKRIEKAEAEAKRAEVAIQKLRNRLALPALSTQKVKLRGEIEEYQKKIEDLDKEMDTIQQRINDRHKAPDGDTADQEGGHGPLPNETKREFLIRTGKITPFSKLAQNTPEAGTLEETLMDAEVQEMVDEAAKGPTSHRNLMKPGFNIVDSSSEASSPASEVLSPPSTTSERPNKRRKLRIGSDVSVSRNQSVRRSPKDAESDDDFDPGMTDRQLATLDESDGEENMNDDEYSDEGAGSKRKATSSKRKATRVVKAKSSESLEEEDMAGVDDGNEKFYRKRVKTWTASRAAARHKAQEKKGGASSQDETEEECFLPHPSEPDTEFDGGFKIPGDIFPALFDYQKTGVQWLWELYTQNVGGIIGDEMGLGKTIQAISFVAGLHYSKMLHKPVLVVCPATVMKQWVNEFHRWWPALRVSILHTSGSGMLDTRREDKLEHDMESGRDSHGRVLTSAGKAAKRVLEKVKRDGHVLVTTYSGLQTYSDFLIPTEWQCAILDEGHKIRNPDTSVTIHCKELLTPNRIILSGTPMQNNLTELWSLFDFVFPMRLGTLVNFRNQFEFPIKRGGYANASNLEFETAVRCAETLKDAVSPYLLQRFKVDVAADLPNKKEQVLFCKLTRQQREAYELFLKSDDMRSIENGKRQMLYGVDYLRKICNHPDLTEHKTLSKKPDYDYGAPRKSGKMQVVKELLSLWKKGGHKTLLFAQHRIMLDILQKFLNRLPDINYRRMDGETPIKDRQDLVDEFNNDPNLHVFLLTTKVGGLGVNLTGANRVIIYDPDWNPSTDMQARERSWRLGQKREVEIYRLMSAGTIEEKIYHRQIFKQFLTNKVLKDPKQRQTFQMNDLHDLFSLGNETDGETETGNLFRGSEVKFDEDGATTAPDGTAAEDLAAMRGIDHTEAFHAPPDANSPGATTSSPPANGESSTSEKPNSDTSRLLSTIFAKSGVHSVLAHDAIIASTSSNRKRRVQADPAITQREAKRHATEAARQLQLSLEEARNTPIGVPTWTGTVGVAGRPQPPPSAAGHSSNARGGLSGRGRGALGSSSVLSNLSARQGRSETLASRRSPPFTGQTMLTALLAFLTTHNNSVPARMLVDHFDRFCRSTPGSKDEFREMLFMVAKKQEEGGRRAAPGRERWGLKDDWVARGREAVRRTRGRLG